MAQNLNTSFLPRIGKKYRDLIQKEAFDAYEELLAGEGLPWYFEFRISRLISHLAPLTKVPGRRRPNPRMQLLLQAIENSADLQLLDSLYRVFFDRKDFEAAAGAAGLALNRIWDAGKSFDPASLWWERMIRLIEEAPLTKLSRAFLYVWKAALTTVWHGQVQASIAASEGGLAEARSAGSRPLELYHMAGIALSAYHATDISKMEFYLLEAQPLSELEDMPLVCTILYRMALTLHLICNGRYAECLRILNSIESDPIFPLLPLALWLFTHSQYLLTYTKMGDGEAVSKAVRAIQQKTVSEDNHFYHAHMHSYLGYSCLSDDPARALLHAREAFRRGNLCHSDWAHSNPWLLIPQALSETGQLAEAEEDLTSSLERFKEREHAMYLIMGLYEMANIKLKQGNLRDAKAFYSQISKVCPHAPVPLSHLSLFRPAAFFKQLDRTLQPSSKKSTTWATRESARVRIDTFGGLKLEIDGRIIGGQLSKGKKSTLLLKAILAHGGTDISAELLEDVLWPDADGDAAAVDLKVTLFRLRQIGLESRGIRAPWIEMKNRRLSLIPSECFVDSLQFERLAISALNTSEPAETMETTFDLYADDFLPYDVNEPWIASRRDHLRGLFIRAVKGFYDKVSKIGEFDRALPYLERALEKAPVDEGLSVRLVSGFLATDRRARAIEAFSRARETLQKELGVGPGARLQALADSTGIGPRPG
ncbi:MAG: bacterial transcriptional activator domain-containing protein [Desulfatiglandaceae bacterium]